MSKRRYQDDLDWDQRSKGEMAQQIGKKLKEKVVKSKKDYKKPKYKNWEQDLEDGLDY